MDGKKINAGTLEGIFRSVVGGGGGGSQPAAGGGGGDPR